MVCELLSQSNCFLKNLWVVYRIPGSWRTKLRCCSGRNNSPNYSGNWKGKDIPAVAVGHRLCCLPSRHNQHRIWLQGQQPLLPLEARLSATPAAPTGHQNGFCMVPFPRVTLG